MSAYDDWLEKPYTDAARVQERFEVEEELFIESEDFMPALIEWLTDQLRGLGTTPRNSEESDCTLPQKFIDQIVDEFRESRTYESIIEGRLDATYEMREPDDYDVSDPYDIEYDR